MPPAHPPTAQPPDSLIRLDPRQLETYQLDDLAGLLYTRMRGHLRRELLVDRERVGMLTDFR
jgi:hypothetical protein